MVSLISVFVASILGSAHCVGMCGGIVLLYSQSGGRLVRPHIAYNVGRFSSYVFLGALAGLLGKTVNLSSTALGIGQIASLLFGLFMVLWGVSLILKRHVPEPTFTGSSKIVKVYQALGKGELQMSQEWRAYTLGLLSTLLPCGWLYLFAAVAAASGNIFDGMLIMGIFWVGTLPYLVSVGVASQYLLGPFRKRLPLITGTLVIIAGLFSIAQHFNAFRMIPVLSGEMMMHHH